jgi:ribosomal protein L39E
MSSGALSREAASAVPSWIMMRTLTQHQHRER